VLKAAKFKVVVDGKLIRWNYYSRLLELMGVEW
jgi:hypothetical protein